MAGVALPPTSLDRDAFDWVVTHRVHALNWLFEGLSWVAKLGAVWVVLALVVGFVVARTVRSSVLLALITFATVWAADSASFGVKHLFVRQRPFLHDPKADPLLTVHSTSFPAGHAATSLAGAVLLAYILPRAALLLMVLATAVCFSRVYVGVHYPTDVLAGALLGALCAAVAIVLLNLARERGSRFGTELLSKYGTGRRDPTPANRGPQGAHV